MLTRMLIAYDAKKSGTYWTHCTVHCLECGFEIDPEVCRSLCLPRTDGVQGGLKAVKNFWRCHFQSLHFRPAFHISTLCIQYVQLRQYVGHTRLILLL